MTERQKKEFFLEKLHDISTVNHVAVFYKQDSYLGNNVEFGDMQLNANSNQWLHLFSVRKGDLLNLKRVNDNKITYVNLFKSMFNTLQNYKGDIKLNYSLSKSFLQALNNIKDIVIEENKEENTIEIFNISGRYGLKIIRK